MWIQESKLIFLGVAIFMSMAFRTSDGFDLNDDDAIQRDGGSSAVLPLSSEEKNLHHERFEILQMVAEHFARHVVLLGAVSYHAMDLVALQLTGLPLEARWRSLSERVVAAALYLRSHAGRLDLQLPRDIAARGMASATFNKFLAQYPEHRWTLDHDPLVTTVVLFILGCFVTMGLLRVLRLVLASIRLAWRLFLKLATCLGCCGRHHSLAKEEKRLDDTISQQRPAFGSVVQGKDKEGDGSLEVRSVVQESGENTVDALDPHSAMFERIRTPDAVEAIKKVEAEPERCPEADESPPKGAPGCFAGRSGGCTRRNVRDNQKSGGCT